MKTLLLTFVWIAAVLALLLSAMWAESRVRLGDLVLFLLSAVAAVAIWYLAFQFCLSKS